MARELDVFGEQRRRFGSAAGPLRKRAGQGNNEEISRTSGARVEDHAAPVVRASKAMGPGAEGSRLKLSESWRTALQPLQ